MTTLLTTPVQPDYKALIDNVLRKGTPSRVHNIELYLDTEVQDAVCRRFDLLQGWDPSDPYADLQKQIRIQRFLGYDTVRASLDDFEMPLFRAATADTADLRRAGGRRYMEEHQGPITSWEEFEKYPWPDPDRAITRSLDWYSQNLPEDMCLIASGGFAHFAEYITWLMGYETLCYALYDQRDLVLAIRDRLSQIYSRFIDRLLQYERVGIIWGSDDMGFKSGTLIGPDDLRELVLPGHKVMATKSHAAGRPYLLHACGKLDAIIPDLLTDVGIDAKHSFEDTIESVIDVKKTYGQHIALLGGIDVDFLCRANQEQIRHRVRATLDVCMPGGGYCLGTGNTVANYIPLDNYLVMLDEGRRYTA